MRARLAAAARDWPWSSARAHLAGRDDGVVMVRPLLDLAADWRKFLRGGLSEEEGEAIRAGERTGRPLGSAKFVARLEKRLKRPARPPEARPQAEIARGRAELSIVSPEFHRNSNSRNSTGIPIPCPGIPDHGANVTSIFDDVAFIPLS